MSSRLRKERAAPLASTTSDEVHLWHNAKAHIKTFQELRTSHAAAWSTYESRKAKWASTHSADEGATDDKSNGSATGAAGNEMKEELLTTCRQLRKAMEEEQREIESAVEQVELLMAVRDDVSVAESTPKHQRKKRKADSLGSASTSPTTQSVPLQREARGLSPLSLRDEASVNQAIGGPTPSEQKKRKASKSTGSSSAAATPQRRGTIRAEADGGSSAAAAVGTNASSSTSAPVGASGTAPSSTAASSTSGSTTAGAPSGPSSTPSSSSTTGYVDPARARREVLGGQLPLKVGRKVAFRQPPKSKAGPGAASTAGAESIDALARGGADDDGETWIMAVITDCINNDRNRYVVKDAEDAKDDNAPTYKTTLKAIVPLPESLQTLPVEDYKVGTQVMGLYPDTSCFYQAVVRGGGPGLSGKITNKMMKRANEILNAPYHLEFEDDGQDIKQVPASLVVERP